MNPNERKLATQLHAANNRIVELETALKNISEGNTQWIDGYHETSEEITREYAKQVLGANQDRIGCARDGTCKGERNG